MLPFLKKKEAPAAGLLIKVRTPDEKPESDQDDPSAAHEACGHAILQAIKSNDAIGIASAIKDLMDLGESDEGSSPHSYDAQNQAAALGEE